MRNLLIVLIQGVPVRVIRGQAQHNSVPYLFCISKHRCLPLKTVFQGSWGPVTTLAGVTGGIWEQTEARSD